MVTIKAYFVVVVFFAMCTQPHTIRVSKSSNYGVEMGTIHPARVQANCDNKQNKF